MAKTQTRTRTATHTEMGRVHVARHNQNLMYTRGQWWYYTGGVWSAYHDQEMSSDIWRLMEEYESKSGLRPNAGTKSSILDMVRARLFVNESQVDGATHLINLTNGVYNLEDEKLYPHNPDYYLTTQLPFAYDPNATAPLWQMYLLSTFIKSLKPKDDGAIKVNGPQPDHELIEFVQEAMGYSLTTSVQHHATFWCMGEGANGKGVLFHVLEQLGGTAAVPLNVGLLRREQYQLADLAGKRIALCSEAGATRNLVEDALIKALIGGDTMNVRQIRREPFVLHPTVKLWWAMNDLPPVADTSEGFWRRVRVIPFNQQFAEKERILDLKERLNSELPGIFRWTLKGLKRLRDRGHFVSPTQVAEATSEYKEESNPVVLFIDACCKVGSKLSVQSSSIYSTYKFWCEDNGFKPLSSKNFKREMERLKFFHKRTSTSRKFSGLKLKIPPFP